MSMLKAVIYTRVSTKLQVDKYSLPAQEKILKDCINKEGQKLVDVYSDAGISGERIVDRPEFLRLLADAEQKRFDVVWVIDQNRLSRGDLADLSYIKKVFKENNISICTPYQKLTLTDVDDDFISDLFGIIAKRERLKTKQAADRGRQEKFNKGEWGGRTAPYGYTYDPQKSLHLTENPEESRGYKIIVSSCLEKGYGLKLIARELNKLGIKRRDGGRWSDKSIHYILRNPVYTGAIVHQKYQKYLTKDNKYRWRVIKGKYVQEAHKPLISREIFDRIQLQLLKNRNKRKTFHFMQLLTGLLECTLCHNSFKVGSTSQGKYRRWIYRCKTRYAHWFDKLKPTCSMRTFDLEDYNAKVWNRIQEIARQPHLIKSALEHSKIPHLKNLKLYEDELNKLIHKLSEFEKYKSNAVALRIKNKINEAEFTNQMESLEKEYQGLASRKREWIIKINYLKRVASEGVDEEAILRYAKFLQESDKKLDIAQKRRILEAFVSRIPIYSNGEFEIVFKFPIMEETPQVLNLQRTTSVLSAPSGGCGRLYLFGPLTRQNPRGPSLR